MTDDGDEVLNLVLTAKQDVGAVLLIGHRMVLRAQVTLLWYELLLYTVVPYSGR